MVFLEFEGFIYDWFRTPHCKEAGKDAKVCKHGLERLSCSYILPCDEHETYLMFNMTVQGSEEEISKVEQFLKDKQRRGMFDAQYLAICSKPKGWFTMFGKPS